jgi:hypothetical protein
MTAKYSFVVFQCLWYIWEGGDLCWCGRFSSHFPNYLEANISWMDLKKSGKTSIYVVMVIPAEACIISAFGPGWLVLDVSSQFSGFILNGRMSEEKIFSFCMLYAYIQLRSKHGHPSPSIMMLYPRRETSSVLLSKPETRDSECGTYKVDVCAG